ncbi:nicotinate-nucleotide--dimethylbenzimidazole phosphoribosyltransferase [Streptomyces sp. NPDC028635]|uniref:nicotinate-nucleotide--dimethylbenzimidazole phosphoribosyltransferase n=1 Tax=Streptomyces sp. NPDC028635 TaxID=3154800 RepID=UPI0033ED3813
MTDTGQVPGEGLPENAGTVEQPGVSAPGAYAYLSESPAEDEDLLLPGSHGAWGNEVAPPAPEPVVEAVHEPGPHELSGRDSGSVDLNGVRLPGPAPQRTAPTRPIPPITPRRPLHLGPPIPDASASPVRSLADRGPADAPVRQAVPSATGPEYLDAPQQAGAPAPAEAAPWPAQAQVAAAAAPAETVNPAAAPQPGPVDAAQAAVARLATEAVTATGSHVLPPQAQQTATETPAHGAAVDAGAEAVAPAEVPTSAEVSAQAEQPEAVQPEAVQPEQEAPAAADATVADAAVAQTPVQDAAAEAGAEVAPAEGADGAVHAAAAGAQAPADAPAQPVAAETAEAPGAENGPVDEPAAEAPTADEPAVTEAAVAEPAVTEAAVTGESVAAQPGEDAAARAVEPVDAQHHPVDAAQPAAPAEEAAQPAEPVTEAAPVAAAEPAAEPLPAEAPPAAQPDAAEAAPPAGPVVPEAVQPVAAPVEASQAPEVPQASVRPAEAQTPEPSAAAEAPQADEPSAADAQATDVPEAQGTEAAPADAPTAPGAPAAAQATESSEATAIPEAQPAAVAPQAKAPAAAPAEAPAAPAPEASQAPAAPASEAAAAEPAAEVPQTPEPAAPDVPQAAEPTQAEPAAAEPTPAAEPVAAEPVAAEPAPAEADQAPEPAPVAAPQPVEPTAEAPLPAEAGVPATEPAPAVSPQPTDTPAADPGTAQVAAPQDASAAAHPPVAVAAAQENPLPTPDEAAQPAPAPAPQPDTQIAAPADATAPVQGLQVPQAPDAPQPPVAVAAPEAPQPAAPQAAQPAAAPSDAQPAPSDAAVALPIGQFVPVDGQVPTTPHLAPTPPHPLTLPVEEPAAQPVAPVPAPREAEADAGVVQHADELRTSAADQDDLEPQADQEQPEPRDDRDDESKAAVAEAPQSTGPAAPAYDEAEREAVLKVMRERRDIRNGFRGDPIPHEVLLRVLEAAHHAPSVGHSQPWDFVVIRSADTRRAMHELAMRQRDAYAKSLPKGRAKQFKELKIEAILDTPVNIVVTADPTRGGRHTLGRHTQPQMAPYSAALAVENLWLAARAEGLGVGWVSFFDEREMVRALGLPEHLEVIAYLCVGYVDEFPDEPELMQAGWSKRRPLSWVVHEETYGRRALPGEEPHDLLAETVAQIRPLDAKALGEAWERQKRMTKPAGALGMLEIISAQLSGLSRQCPPPIPEPAAVAIFAGDHGVHAQGVTPWPQEVTAQMVANFLGGGAVCNAFANQVGAEVCVVDVGVVADLPATPGLLPRKIRGGTSDMTTGPAMTREEAKKAIEVGIETARDLVAAGNKALLTGEMGIANTTASAALISVYTGADPAEVTGRGTGINDETLARKTDVVRRALELHQPDPADPIGVLAAIGGFEHAAMVGLLLGGASLRTPVILDGVSAGAAALVARAIAPEVLAACIAGHRSAEPGHVAALNKLGLRPLVDLDLRLGEGTGALLALPLVQSTARAMHEVATFDSAGVTEK